MVQCNLRGEVLPVIDSEIFGHNYPTKVNTNCSIITYQNVGQQPKYGFQYKAKETAKSFRDSKASIAMYNKTGLNQTKLERCDKFNDRMKKINPRSISYHCHNQNLPKDEVWNVPGGVAMTIDENLLSHQINNGNGKDKELLGRWTWTRVRGKDNVHTQFITAYRP